MKLKPLYEDNHLIAVDKPAGLLTQGDLSERENLLDQVRSFLKSEYRKPGRVFLGMVHRLDRQVSGVVLFAKTSKAASRLARQFRERTVVKLYLALVHELNAAEPPEERWKTAVHNLSRQKNRTVPVAGPAPASREAAIMYRSLACRGGRRLLLVRLLSGRKHQIRAQLSALGMPIVGDTLYGSKVEQPGGRIALHAVYLGFTHPVLKETLALQSPPPALLWSGLDIPGFSAETVLDMVKRAIPELPETP